MSTFIKNRVFGAPVSEDVKDFFKNLQKGIFDIDPTDSIEAGKYKDYLGDRTPFVRMWSAVQVSGSAVDPVTNVKTQRKITKYFVVNDNNQESYSNFDVNKPIKIGHKKFATPSFTSPDRVAQLTDNPRFRPAAGITAVTTKTEGALGVIKSTTVEFTVYNFEDFQDIFLPYFLRPGARIVVDYGWTLNNAPTLYDLDDIIKNADDELSDFYTNVYGTKTKGKHDGEGWVNHPEHKGFVDT